MSDGVGVTRDAVDESDQMPWRIHQTLVGTIRPAVRNGDLAITSTVRPGNATVEVARRQADGTWLWIIDQTRCS
jgi:hypothetical protein